MPDWLRKNTSQVSVLEPEWLRTLDKTFSGRDLGCLERQDFSASGGAAAKRLTDGQAGKTTAPREEASNPFVLQMQWYGLGQRQLVDKQRIASPCETNVSSEKIVRVIPVLSNARFPQNWDLQ